VQLAGGKDALIEMVVPRTAVETSSLLPLSSAELLLACWEI